MICQFIFFGFCVKELGEMKSQRSLIKLFTSPSTLSNFLNTGRFDLNEEQQILILIGIACTYFYDNTRVLKVIHSKIKSEGLSDVFKEVLTKSKNLKKAFVSFLSSAKVTASSTLDIVAYAFLIPIITDIMNGALEGGDPLSIAKTIAINSC